MKQFKRSFSFLLALALVLSLAIVPALADDTTGGGTETSTTSTYQIIVSNPGKNDVYKAYKIFDVTYSTQGSGDSATTVYSYTIQDNSPWWSAVLEFMGYTVDSTSGAITTTLATDGGTSTPVTPTTTPLSGKGLTLTYAPGSDKTVNGETVKTYVVEGSSKDSDGNETKLSAAAFAEYLAAKAVADTGSTPTYTAADTVSVASDATEPIGQQTINLNPDEPGYYLVTCLNTAHQAEGETETKTALAELTTAAPTVTITDKNAWPLFDKKQTDEATVAQGVTTPTNYTDLARDTEIGDTVYYQITDTVPDTTGATKFVYSIDDRMTEGLTIDTTSETPSVTVKIKGVEADGKDKTLTSNDTYTLYPIVATTGTTGAYDTYYLRKTENLTDSYYKWNEVAETAAAGWSETAENTTPSDTTLVGFQLNIEMSKLQDYVLKQIEVTYSATVNEKAVSGVETNTAVLQFTHDPASTELSTREEKTDVYNAAIEVVKYDSKGGTVTDATNADKLAGAGFVLYRWALNNNDALSFTTTNGAAVTAETTDAVKAYYKYDTTNKSVGWTTTQTEATTLMTGADGKFSVASSNAPSITSGSGESATTLYYFGGLEEGTYYLLETAAPQGYNLLDAPVEIKLNHDAAVTDNDGDVTTAAGLLYTDATNISDTLLLVGTKTETVDGTETTTNILMNSEALDVTASVGNESGQLLPSTGGMGTTVFYVVGGILVLGAVLLLVTRKRMDTENRRREN